MSRQVIMKRIIRFVPGIILGLILILLYQSLTKDVEDEMVEDKAFPRFALNDIREPQKKLTLEALKGKVSVVHIWATWCGVCVEEHSEWLRIKEKWPMDLVGIVFRDDNNKVNKLMQEKGDPYQFLMNDISGNLGLALGLRGTPETYIVDKQGSIRYHVLGAMTLDKFESELLPILEAISQENV